MLLQDLVAINELRTKCSTDVEHPNVENSALLETNRAHYGLDQMESNSFSVLYSIFKILEKSGSSLFFSLTHLYYPLHFLPLSPAYMFTNVPHLFPVVVTIAIHLPASQIELNTRTNVPAHTYISRGIPRQTIIETRQSSGFPHQPYTFAVS